jgi:hypothetical protein
MEHFNFYSWSVPDLLLNPFYVAKNAKIGR